MVRRLACSRISKAILVVVVITVAWMVYSDFQPVPVTPLTDKQAWPAVTNNESCNVYSTVYPTVEYTGPVCEECKDGVPISNDGLYIPYNGNLYEYLPRGGSGIDHIDPSCGFIAEGRGNTVPEPETLLNVILGGLIMICIRRRYAGK